MKFVRLKLSMSLRVTWLTIHMSVIHAFGVHKPEQRPTQSGCDYAWRFTSNFSGTLVSLLLSLLKLRNVSPARECDVRFTYVRVCVCVWVRRIFYTTAHLTHFLYLSPAAPLASVPFHASAHTYTRRFAEWTIDYVFASITRLRYTLSFQPISRPVPFAPDSPVEIKGDLEMRVLAE